MKNIKPKIIKPKIIKVPQDLLWNANPKRKDVIDLNLQTIHTFTSLLATVLPEKLRQHNQVWILLHRSNKLELAPLTNWLHSNKYEFIKGKDIKALCVLRKQR